MNTIPLTLIQMEEKNEEKGNKNKPRNWTAMKKKKKKRD